jgi:hypothetical protein
MIIKYLKRLKILISRKCNCGGIKNDIYYDAETNLIMEKCNKCGKENLH